MKNIITAFIFIFLIISCERSEQNNSKIIVVDNYIASFSSTQLNNNLTLAYNHKNLDSLNHFFLNWNKLIKPNSYKYVYQNDTLKTVFDIYKAFYKPHDLLKLGDWEWANELNSNSEYIVVQNKLFYSVTKTKNLDDYDWKNNKMDSVYNFRPPVDIDEQKVLYLTAEYEAALYNFLGTESTELGEGNIMNPSEPESESEKRYEFIRPIIPILHGHWSGYWHLETHPEVSSIVLNNNLSQARIFFRVGYQGGESLLEKDGKEWVIKESQATWIE